MNKQEYLDIIQQIWDKIPEYEYNTQQYKECRKYSKKIQVDNK